MNHTYAIVSSSLTFWLPVLIMITLYYKVYLEAKRHMDNMRQRQFSVPAMCLTSAIPSICSIGVVTPSSYTLKVAMSQSDQQTDQYEAVKAAAGEGRRMSDCIPYHSHHHQAQVTTTIISLSYQPRRAQSLSNYLN